MAIRLAFVDSNSSYVEKLTAWIHKFMPYQFSIEILTAPKSFTSWAGNGGEADCTLVSVDLFEDLQPGLPKDGVLILDDGSHRTVLTEAPRILKYRPAEEIVKDILSLCAERLPRIHTRDEHNSAVNLITSFDGADTIYPAAPSIAYLLAQKDKKVFYVSLEHNQITNLYFESNNSRGLNEMLYYVKSNKNNLSMRIETCSGSDANTGIDFLKAPPGLLLSGEIDAGDAEKLLSAIAERNMYDEVVLVTDAEVDDKYIHLIKNSDRVIFAAINTAGSCLRLKKFLEGLKKIELDLSLLADKLGLILVKLGDYYGFNEQFPDIKKAYVEPNVTAAGGAGWIPSESDLSILNSLFSDLKSNGGYK